MVWNWDGEAGWILTRSLGQPPCGILPTQPESWGMLQSGSFRLAQNPHRGIDPAYSTGNGRVLWPVQLCPLCSSTQPDTRLAPADLCAALDEIQMYPRGSGPQIIKSGCVSTQALCFSLMYPELKTLPALGKE